MTRTIRDEEHLEELLSEPTPGATETLSALDGDVLVLGAAGKIGPTLCRMARRALDAAGSKRKVIAVSRFSEDGSEEKLQQYGVETHAADLLAPRAFEFLPDAPLVLYLAGRKFGAEGDPGLTWAMNAFLPGLVARRYHASRIVAFSTGNVYPLTPTVQGGSVETDLPAPVGEYAMSCLGRERIFAHFAQQNVTPTALLRLNYATELRYGVPVDIAGKVWRGEEIDLAMGAVNVVWQGDANAWALQALGAASTPATVLNLAGPETLSVRRMAQFFTKRFDKPALLVGEEAAEALLSNGQAVHARFGYPRVPVQTLLEWVADWTQRGGKVWEKPTHYEARDGKF
jgi:nucleoside-diphosphate-sugar epimerase